MRGGGYRTRRSACCGLIVDRDTSEQDEASEGDERRSKRRLANRRAFEWLRRGAGDNMNRLSAAQGRIGNPREFPYRRTDKTLFASPRWAPPNVDGHSLVIRM